MDFSSRYRVGKYGVDIAGFEGFWTEISFDRQAAGLVMIDEIGKMECLSRRFQEQVRALLNSGRMLIATVALHGGGLIEEIKRRQDVRIYTLTPRNRETMLKTILTETQLLETKHQTPNTKP